MAKSLKARAVALNTSTAKIGSNSGITAETIDVSTHDAAIAALSGYGEDYRSGTAKAETAQLNAGIAYGRAVKAGSMKADETGTAEAVNAYNNALSEPSKKSLRTQFKTFADADVVECAVYDGLTKADGKSLFQTALAVNHAIKRTMKAQAKAKTKVRPTVDADFIEAAKEYSPDTKPASDDTKAKRAAKSLAKIFTDTKAVKVRKLLVEEFTVTHIRAIDTLYQMIHADKAA
jgi:hypothetical protein